MPPEMCAMPDVITVISSDCVISRQIRPDRQRRLGLPHENAGGDVQRLGAARAHHPVHQHGKEPHDDLHHAEVIEDREKRGDEDDRRQHLEREDDAYSGALRPKRAVHDAAPHGVAKRAEDERRTHAGKTEETVMASPSAENTPARPSFSRR